MAQQFNNGESNASIRAKLNANAVEINENTTDIEELDSDKAPKANPSFTGTVTGVSKAAVGLGNADNTSDVNKPISSATQTALNLKADTSAIPTKASLGLSNVDNTSDVNKPVSTAQATAINLRVPNTRTVAGKALSADVTLAKGDVGLGNVDNTSDINKPISALTSNALANKADLIEGVLPIEQLPDTNLSTSQFVQLTIGSDITINETWLTNFIIAVGAAQGWGSLTPLDTPTMSFGTSTESQNVINWTEVDNATSYTLQVNLASIWTTIYTGALLTFTHTGLEEGTTYQYRVQATGAGYSPSSYGTGSKSTASSGGGSLVQTVKLRMGVNAHGSLPTGWALYLFNGPGNTSTIDNTEGEHAGFMIIDTLSVSSNEETGYTPLVSDPDFPDEIVEYLCYNADAGETKSLVLTGCTPGHEYHFTIGIMQGTDSGGEGTIISLNGVENDPIMFPTGRTVYKNSTPFVATPNGDSEILFDIIPFIETTGYGCINGLIIEEYTV